ncbi:MAG: hypothetical protein IIC74_09435, partial [Bacteroidetes bacterium]|nr:hypothetical protein [Bacteroidota bacterium]
MLESNYENNERTLTFTVQDFNINQLIQENRDLQRKIIKLEGTDQISQEKLIVCQQDVLGKSNEVNACQSNLNICNTNNATKIANWMIAIDANKNIQIDAIKSSLQTCETREVNTLFFHEQEINAVTNEKGQWEILVIM